MGIMGFVQRTLICHILKIKNKLSLGLISSEIRYKKILRTNNCLQEIQYSLSHI